MKYRDLGNTGLKVSEIGFGAWGIGGRTEGLTSYGETDDATSIAALRRALDEGINFYDTSSVYGYGRSEELIGQAFQADRSRVIIATKAGISRWGAEQNFSPAWLTESLDGSLRRLQTDYVDLFQLHNPTPETFADPAVLQTLNGFVKAGKARAWGASVRSPEEALKIHQATPVPVLQINLNMMDVRAVDSGLLRLAADREVGIIARTPLCFGFLSGAITRTTTFPDGDHRRGWSAAQIARWIDGADRLMKEVSLSPGESRTHAALRFCLSFPSVSTVIAGMMTPAEVEEDAGASRFGSLSEAEVAAVLAINKRESFFVGSPQK